MARDLEILPRAKNLLLVIDHINTIGELNKIGPDSPKRARSREIMNVRRKILREVDRDIRRRSHVRPVLFLSFSGLGRKLAEHAAELAKEYDFEIKTGFDTEVEIGHSEDIPVELNLPQAIISQIFTSNYFLGIWTHDFEEARNRSGTDGRGGSLSPSLGAVPSVWMPFELGVAAALGLPFRQLVMEGMHQLFYEKPFNTQAQIVFNAANFEKKLRAAFEYFVRKTRNKASIR
jgi:hypothetical protein